MNNLFNPEYNLSLALKEEGLKLEDYQEICRRLKRAPNRTELGMFGVMWSEHCCYRNSKPLLQDFPTSGPQVLVGPGENAGVIDLGCNQRLVFKIESHNHPSAVEPFQGAATGVGGILRDIFTMGARPIALLNALRFGSLDDPKNVALLEGVVSGIAHYGNCVGVPTVGGEIVFDDSYSGNPLVNAMAIGLMETDEIVCSGANGIGYPILYVGSTTGRDGMGGASFASAELTNASIDDRPAVQVGDPFLEKGLIEACLEAFKTGDIIAAQDMGAAGLTCSCSEMASKGGVGVELNLDLVPAREDGMSAYDFLLSESQERMLFVIKPNAEIALMNLFSRWGLNVAIVGKVLQENIIRVLHKGKIAAELPASALADDTPVESHKLLKDPPNEIKQFWNWNEINLPECNIIGIKKSNPSDLNKNIFSWNHIILDLLDNPTIASKKWIYNQYDHQVQVNTIISPGEADSAVIRLRPQNQIIPLKQNRGIAAVVDCSNRWAFLDPERGSIASVVEASRNITCVGAKPLAVTDNLNFQSPESDFGYWQLSTCCKGIADACRVLKTPVIGGNVSLYNETRDLNNVVKPIHPTPVIGMVGIIDDLNSICKQGWKSQGDSIWLIGIPLEKSNNEDPRVTLSASIYLEQIHNKILGRPPKIDFSLELLVQSFVQKSISKGYINSAHDISDGGLAICIAECCISSGLGAHINIPESTARLDRLLFGEGGSRIIVSISSEKLNDWKDFLNNFNSPSSIAPYATQIGKVEEHGLMLINQMSHKLVELSLNEIKQKFENAIPMRIAKFNSLS